MDPADRLPGAPDPWAGSAMPAWRDGPPYAMTEMIAAEPALAARLAERLAADDALARLATAVRAAERVMVTGCGTSEHAAMGIAAMLRATRVNATAAAAMEVALDAPDGVVIGVSHEGGTRITNAALGVARGAGATTALITVSGRSPGAAFADILVATDEMDQSWAHTVGYLSPLLVGASLAAAVGGGSLDPVAARAAVAPAPGLEAAVDAAAARLAATARIVVAGSGTDHITARELALKLEETCRVPSVAREVETVLHGHLATADATTAIVLVLSDMTATAPLLERATTLCRAAAELSTPVAGLLGPRATAAISEPLTPGGRIALPSDAAESVATALLSAAIPLQLLAERLARARGVNPDTIGREDPQQLAAASVPSAS